MNKDKVTPKKEQSEDGEKQSVIKGFVDTYNKISSVTGVVNTDSLLAIVPVQVKAKNGNNMVISGSTATFCTERLMNELNLHG